MDTRFAISQYPDAAKITKQLDRLISLPVYSIRQEALQAYVEEYYHKRCAGSKALIDQAVSIIPGGVQHNLAFNYPFPLVFTKAEGSYLYLYEGVKPQNVELQV